MEKTKGKPFTPNDMCDVYTVRTLHTDTEHTFAVTTDPDTVTVYEVCLHVSLSCRLESKGIGVFRI